MALRCSIVAATEDTAARVRTRRVIVEAAITTLAGDPAASLTDIADRAGVGRSTLHRYFPDRNELHAAVAAAVNERLAEAQRRADLAGGTGREALIRLAREYFDLGDALSFMFAGNVDVSDGSEPCDEVTDATTRGHADGTVDAAFPPQWVDYLMWCLLYAGWSLTNDAGGSRHDALQLIVRSLDGALRPAPDTGATPSR